MASTSLRKRASAKVKAMPEEREDLLPPRPTIKQQVKQNVPLLNFPNTFSIAKWLGKKPTEHVKQKVSFLSLLRFSTRKEKGLMALGLFAAFFYGIGLPVWLLLLARALDTFNNLAILGDTLLGGGSAALFDLIEDELYQMVLAFVYVGIVSLFTGTIYVGLWTYTGERQAVRIKNLFVQSALKQDAKWFDLNDREELPTMIAGSMVHLHGALGRTIADIFANIVTAIGCLGVALYLNAPLALIMLCVVPAVAIIIAVISCFVRKNSQRSSEQFAQAGAIATETISGIKTIASLGAQKWALEKYENLCRGAQKNSVYSGMLSGLAAGLTGLLFYCFYALAFTVGTKQVVEDMNMPSIVGCLYDQFNVNVDCERIQRFPPKFDCSNSTISLDPPDPSCRVTGASVMICIYGVILCATFFGLMAPMINNLDMGRQAAVDVFDTICRIPEIDSSSDEGIILKKEDVHGQVEFRDVIFSYPSRPDYPIFYKLNIHIKPGQNFALVGPSGSGKSSIAKLLLRFYDPAIGDVLMDGVSIKDLNIKWFRQQIGYVSQEPILFPGTIRENIAVGKAHDDDDEYQAATEEEVISAAKAASAHDFIMAMPNGYDTFYSGASIQLSGGQMQRISIARAMIRNPVLLLLDEATSALDTNSERQVQAALENIRKTKQITTITVAHRLSTIMGSDQIAVIADGGVAELGDHKSLLEAKGIYATLCESQGITIDSVFDSNDAILTSVVTDDPVSLVKESDVETGLVSDKQDGTFLDEPEPERELAKLAPMWRLWKLNQSEWFYMIIGVLGAMVVGALSPIEAIFTAQIVANFYVVAPEELMDTNRLWIMLFFSLAAASLVGNLMISCGFSVCGHRLTRRIRTMAFESIVRKHIGWFDDPEHSTGELTTRLEGDAEAVSKTTGFQLGYRIRIFSSLLTGVIIAFLADLRIGIVAVICVPFIIGASVLQAVCMSRRFIEKSDGLSPATILEQGLRGISAVQAYNLEKHVGEDYAKSLEPEIKGKTKQGIIAGLVYGFSQFAIFASFAALFYAGAQLMMIEDRGDRINFATFFTAVLAVMFGAIGVAQVQADFNARKDGQVAAARIFKIVDEPLDGTDPFSDAGDTPDSFNGSISFNSVGFAYPTRPNNPIYYASDDNPDAFSLEITPKESVAFVGESGCGKSTALQLVLRFYEASSGSVCVDGQNVGSLNIGWLRRQIGYVGQQPILFSGTIRENILLGNPDASEEEVVTAAEAANAHEFIMKLPDGYDTDVGTSGSLFSGGQRQRIAIARAIVGNPQMLVLDEATAALDNESERVVNAALEELQKKQPRTTLMVAHRLTTVKGCDKIAVLDNGGVKELGTHSALVDQKGLYHQLWSKQGGAD